MAKTFRLVIHFVDGSTLDAEVPAQTDDPHKQLKNIRSAMDIDKLMVEVEGQLMLIPLNNVKYLQISPAPENLPNEVIKGGRLVS